MARNSADGERRLSRKSRVYLSFVALASVVEDNQIARLGGLTFFA